MKLGPGGGTMEAREGERAPYSKSYDFSGIKERDGVLVAGVNVLDGKIKAEVSGEGEERTLTIKKLLRPGGLDKMSALVMIKGLIVSVKEELEKKGERLKHVEIPIDGDQDLSHLFHLEGVGEIFGSEEVQAAKDLYNPRPDEVPKRRAGERPTRISLTLEEITERLKEYEARHGEIRQ